MATIDDVYNLLVGCRVLYVDGSSAGVGTRASPFSTIAAAVSAANVGDTIHLLAAGSPYSGAVDISAKALTLEGDSQALVTVTHSSGATITMGTGCTVRRLTAVTTDTSAGQAIVVANSVKNVLLEDLTVTGTFDGIYFTAAFGVVIRRVAATGTYDGMNCSGVTGLLVEDSTFSTNSTYLSGNGDYRAVVGDSITHGVFRRCRITATRNDTTAQYTYGILCCGNISLEDCFVSAVISNASWTGQASAINNTGASASKHIQLRGVTTVTSKNVNSTGTVYDIVNSSGTFFDNGGNTYSASKISGTAPVAGDARVLDVLQAGV